VFEDRFGPFSCRAGDERSYERIDALSRVSTSVAAPLQRQCRAGL